MPCKKMIVMRIKCRIEAGFPDEKSRKAAVSAVSHEAKVAERSSAKITEDDKKMVLDIEARDVVALRATANAYLRALQVFEGIIRGD